MRNIDWQEIGFVEGHSNRTYPKEYLFVNSVKLSGVVHCRLEKIDIGGYFEYSNFV